MFRTAIRHGIQALEMKQMCFSSAAGGAAAAVKISDEEVKQFEEDGATVVRHLFSPDWMEKLRNVAEVDMNTPGPLCDEHVKPDKPGPFHDDQFLWMQHEVMNKSLFESPVGEIAKHMTRWGNGFQTFRSNNALLEGKASLLVLRLAVHQRAWNSHYYSLAQRSFVLAIDWHQVVPPCLALDYIPKSSCVQYVKGSHKGKLMHKIRSFAGNEGRYQDVNQDSLPDMPEIDKKLDERCKILPRYRTWAKTGVKNCEQECRSSSSLAELLSKNVD